MLQEKEFNMLYVGQMIYRFKFDLTSSKYGIIKHTFQITSAKEQRYAHKKYIEYCTKCIEDPAIKYKGGYYREEESFDFEKAKPSGRYIYVLLKEDDANYAKQIVGEYLDAQIAKCKVQLLEFEKKSSILAKLI